MNVKIKVNVIKRNGEEVRFDISKIVNAIKKANNEVIAKNRLNEDSILSIANNIAIKAKGISYSLNVEDIQDMVEIGIMKNKGYEVAQKYVRYRYKRELSRNANTTDENILSLINQVNENTKQENSRSCLKNKSCTKKRN